ncbi:hypothetical protein NJC38_17050 [Pseudomonas sp. 21LCFQ010]|uniref:hypothetical protein n=1 Tax=Pseudomonas sp. 21LCFQ010 TaxID=2957506 RepID=UPI00209828B2|nr:hypothetical protein [Pseudomonas sp. 21LCFQ010]MCO8163863.1 hypothetical protein [Pseudomonas sp. 21LCFQ010]
MPTTTLMYNIGYTAGLACRWLRDNQVLSITAAWQAWRLRRFDKLCETPAMVRKGINLDLWYGNNVRPARHPQPDQQASRSSLDQFI